MGKRLSVDDRLSAIRRLRDQGPSARVMAELRSALGDKSNLIVAAAAAIAGDQKLVELAPDLVRAFERSLVDPPKTDKLCRAKLAIIQALDKLEHEQPEIFRRAAAHVQLEPVWGGQEDTAAPLRAAGLIALARLDDPGLLPRLIDALTDPQKEVRIAAAQILGDHGTESAALLLRLKARVGDGEPEVITECLLGLLNASPRENLPLVAEFLDAGDMAVREAAILALGRSSLPGAFDLLTTCWHRNPLGLAEAILVAIAMLRLPAASDFLLDLVATGPETVSAAALSAVMIRRYDPRLRERIAEAVRKNGSPLLRARLERDTRMGE
jgi:HEAT repeat protein